MPEICPRLGCIEALTGGKERSVIREPNGSILRTFLLFVRIDMRGTCTSDLCVHLCVLEKESQRHGMATGKRTVTIYEMAMSHLDVLKNYSINESTALSLE